MTSIKLQEYNCQKKTCHIKFHSPSYSPPLESHHLIHLAREIISLNTFGIALITIGVNQCALSTFGARDYII